MNHRTEAIPYGPPSFVPGLPPFMAELLARVMLGDKTPDNRVGYWHSETIGPRGHSGDGYDKPPSCRGFQCPCSLSVPGSRNGFRIHGGSIGEYRIQDPQSDIWTMVGRSMGKAKSGLREDIEI